jgi:hypothetical protein
LQLRQIGLIPTPWTAFSFAIKGAGGTEQQINSPSEPLLNNFFPAITEGIETFISLHNKEEMVHRIMKDYGHTYEDSVQWMSACKYAQSLASIDTNKTLHSLSLLKDAGLVNSEVLLSNIVSI